MEDLVDHQFINGPINIIRLEGKVGDIQKVLYLFMDRHIPACHQTKCSNIFAKDMALFLAETMSRLQDSTQQYDFFLEVRSDELTDEEVPAMYGERYLYTQHWMYIEEVLALFKRVFHYNPAENKVYRNARFKNFRFHFFDIRNYFKAAIQDVIHRLNMALRGKQEVSVELLKTVIGLQVELKEMYLTVIGALKAERGVEGTVVIKIHDLIDKDVMQQLGYKLKERYDHPEVKALVTKMVGGYIKDMETYVGLVNHFIDTLSRISEKVRDCQARKTCDVRLYQHLLKNSRMMASGASGAALDIFARLTDAYFLRRFLDKDYITHGIHYGGGYHGAESMFWLVKEMGFVVTHVANDSEPPEDITKWILEAQTHRHVFDIFDNDIQCSSMEHMPADFLGGQSDN